MSVCDDVMEWVELGASLHTPQSDLDNIEHTHGEDPARCRRELFKVQTLHTMYTHCTCTLCLQVHVHVHCNYMYMYMYMFTCQLHRE